MGSQHSVDLATDMPRLAPTSPNSTMRRATVASWLGVPLSDRSGLADDHEGRRVVALLTEVEAEIERSEARLRALLSAAEATTHETPGGVSLVAESA